MKTNDERSSELHYVIRTVEGARHAGWYRLVDESRLEVMSEGHCVTVPATSGSLEDQAREVLKEIASMTASAGNSAQEKPNDADARRGALPPDRELN